MNIYFKKQRWKLILFLVAIFIVVTSLWYTNRLVNSIANDEKNKVTLWADAVQKKAKLVKFTNILFQKLQTEERKKAELYALATKQLNNELSDISFVLQVLQDNTTVPVILTDDRNQVIASRNFDSIIANNKERMQHELEALKTMYQPVVIDVYKGQKNYLYYKDSRLFNDIKVVFDSLIKSFISEVAINSAAVPVIYTDSTKLNVIAFGNIDSIKINDSIKLKSTIQSMENQNTPLLVDLGEGRKKYIFYEQSNIRTQFK